MRAAPPNKDRRTSERVPVHLPARYVSEETVLSGSIANLSRTALFLQSEFLDDPGHEVEVTFALPGEADPVAVRGRVIRVNDGPLCPGMAIRFTAMPQAVRHRLRRFLDRRAPRRLDPPPA